MTGNANVGFLAGVPPAPVIALVRAGDVLGFLVAEQGGECLGLAAQADCLAFDLIEVGLEILKRQREVEDVDVATAVAAKALPTRGPTAAAPYTAPAVIAPRKMKLERVMP